MKYTHQCCFITLMCLVSRSLVVFMVCFGSGDTRFGSGDTLFGSGILDLAPGYLIRLRGYSIWLRDTRFSSGDYSIRLGGDSRFGSGVFSILLELRMSE